VKHRIQRTRREDRSAFYRPGKLRRKETVRNPHITSLTPLVFQRRSPFVTLTTEQVDERARHRRRVQLERYRHTTQYAEGLLQLYPTLIRFLMPAKGATVRTIY